MHRVAKNAYEGLCGLACCLALFVLPERPALALPGDLLRTFQKPTPAPGDHFGSSVAVIGNTIVVGAGLDDTAGADAGAVYLFDSTTGALKRTILSPTPNAGDQFGVSVAPMGNDILVGARYARIGGAQVGAAYLFDGQTGNLLRAFPNPTPAADDNFGYVVTAVGGNVLVGAYGDDTGVTDAGAAYLFDGTSGALLHALQKATPAVNDRFGISVAAVGNKALIGAMWDDTGATDTGAAYLFDSSTGGLLRTLQNPAPAAGDAFGASVGGVGNRAIVGAPYIDSGGTNSGAAYLFDCDTGDFIGSLRKPVPVAGDEFGVGVAAVGSDILVGAWFDDTAGPDAGAVYQFDGATGGLLHTYLNPTPTAGDRFGCWSLASIGNDVLVGAYRDDTGGIDAGAVYLFEGVPEPATLSLLALLALSLPKRGACASLLGRRK